MGNGRSGLQFGTPTLILTKTPDPQLKSKLINKLMTQVIACLRATQIQSRNMMDKETHWNKRAWKGEFQITTDALKTRT